MLQSANVQYPWPCMHAYMETRKRYKNNLCCIRTNEWVGNPYPQHAKISSELPPPSHFNCNCRFSCPIFNHSSYLKKIMKKFKRISHSRSTIYILSSNNNKTTGHKKI